MQSASFMDPPILEISSELTVSGGHLPVLDYILGLGQGCTKPVAAEVRHLSLL